MLAFEDDSHFERKAEIAILRFSKKGWPLIVGGETALCIDVYSFDVFLARDTRIIILVNHVLL
ncbi:MAG: hypothetical protein M3Y53_02835 [Thermoproteota archaeon]|nr:hypothetical protein [Thermoproteota archaeon]